MKDLKKVLPEGFKVYWNIHQEILVVQNSFPHNNSVQITKKGAVRLNDYWKPCGEDDYKFFKRGAIESDDIDEIIRFICATWKE
jgi:hypothetical protein